MTFLKLPTFIICICLLHLTSIGVPLGQATPVNTYGARSNDKQKNEAIEKAAKKLQNHAEKSYEDAEYWQAAVDLILILDFYPQYSKVQNVIFDLGRSFYEMEMYEGADELYRYLLQSVKRPGLVAGTILGLQKVAFQQSDYQQSLKFYQVLESHYSQSEGIQEARYFAEQTYFNFQNYKLVQNIASHINKKSTFYPFAKYTAGLAHLKKQRLRDAISEFLEVTRLSTKGAERQAIVDEAHLTVGYVYFELSDYEAATKHFLAITPAFYGYPDALLAAGWASFKGRDYRSALASLNRLVERFPEYYNLEEAYFLRGHCYLRLGYYGSAVTEYDRIFHGVSDTTESTRRLNATRLSLEAQQKRIEELRTQLSLLESKLVQSIPFDADQVPAEIAPEDPQIVQKAREELIGKILSARKEVGRVTGRIEGLRKKIDMTEMRKKWEAYAEYGKVRALFLQGMTSE